MNETENRVRFAEFLLTPFLRVIGMSRRFARFADVNKRSLEGENRASRFPLACRCRGFTCQVAGCSEVFRKASKHSSKKNTKIG